MRKLILGLILTCLAIPASAQVVVNFSTAGSGSWVVPPNVTTITGRIRAAGGGGDNSDNAGDGGGACVRQITVTPGSTVFYNVGTHGNGTSSFPGGNGTNSWFNAAANAQPTSSVNGCFATGGKGSVGGPGSGSLGSNNFSGGHGVTQPSYATAAGGGGADYLGNGGSASGGTPGSGGNPAGGQGGYSGNPAGSQPGGGGYAPAFGSPGGNGGDGEITFVYQPVIFNHPFISAIVP